MRQLPNTPEPQVDERFTHGLIFDVFRVLEAHGYVKPTDEQDRNRAVGAAVAALLPLVTSFEGTHRVAVEGTHRVAVEGDR